MNSIEWCRHIKSDNENFCYMFRHKPETLPCGQHDKFAEIRKKVENYYSWNLLKSNWN